MRFINVVSLYNFPNAVLFLAIFVHFCFKAFDGFCNTEPKVDHQKMDTFIVTFSDIAANGILVWCLEWCCNTAYFHSGVANGCLRIAMQHVEHNIYNISADATCNYFVCDFHT